MKKRIDNKIKICTKCGSTAFEIKKIIGTCKNCGSTFYYKSSFYDLFLNLTKLDSSRLKKQENG
jgi:hypothetical protein